MIDFQKFAVAILTLAASFAPTSGRAISGTDKKIKSEAIDILGPLKLDQHLVTIFTNQRKRTLSKHHSGFVQNVLSSQFNPSPIVIGDPTKAKRWTIALLKGFSLDELLPGMADTGVAFFDPRVNKTVPITMEHIEVAINAYNEILELIPEDLEFYLEDAKQIGKLFYDSRFGKAAYDRWNREKTEFFDDYLLTANILNELGSVYLLETKVQESMYRGKIKLLKSAKFFASSVLIAVRKLPRGRDLTLLNGLAKEHFKGIYHLWMDPLMIGNSTVAQQILTPWKGQVVYDELLQVQAFWRNETFIRVLENNERRHLMEQKLFAQLTEGLKTYYHHMLSKELYNDASSDPRDNVVPMFLGLLFLSEVGFPFLEAKQWGVADNLKPAIIGGADDTLGGLMQTFEMVSHKGATPEEKRNALKNTVLATLFAGGTSLLTALPFFGPVSDIKDSVIKLSAQNLAKAPSWMLYGALSSGGTLAMAILPLADKEKSIKSLASEGKIPLEKMTPATLKRWLRREARKSHWSFTTQHGGLVGVGLSAVLAPVAFFLPIPPNYKLIIAGMGETLTTLGFIAGERFYNRNIGYKHIFYKSLNSQNISEAF